MEQFVSQWGIEFPCTAEAPSSVSYTASGHCVKLIFPLRADYNDADYNDA